MEITGRMPSFSTHESDGDNKTHAIILDTREGDSMRGGHLTPSPQNPKPQNPFHEREWRVEGCLIIRRYCTAIILYVKEPELG
jgi:hypothetical protein